MAIITCPECQHHPVSDRAASCSVCGCPIAFGHRFTARIVLDEYGGIEEAQMSHGRNGTVERASNR